MTFSDLRRVGGKTKEKDFIRGEKEKRRKKIQPGRKGRNKIIGGEREEKSFNGGKREGGEKILPGEKGRKD